jgi:hypothetical protein
MTTKELTIHLNSLTTGEYFSEKLFKKDHKIFRRRSFDDLFCYYKSKGVSEKQLLSVLYNNNFRAQVCGVINKVIFFKQKINPSHSIWKTPFLRGHTNITGYNFNRYTSNTKYDDKYIDKLFESLKLTTKL